MKRIERKNLRCPHCGSNELETRALGCPGCEVEIRAPVVDNEFTRLSGEDLHFLRVFIHCEGKIKDVEKALGLSYPSVKSRLQGLKEALLVKVREAEAEVSTAAVLAKIQNGELTYEAGLKLLREAVGRETPKGEGK